MIYSITASYGQYSDHCDILMYTTADLDNARAVMVELQESIIAAMDTITVAGHHAIANCNESVWNIASGAHWEGMVDIAIRSMEMDVVAARVTFIEGVVAESSRERIYNRDVRDHVADETPCLSKYEVLALPYEAKYAEGV